MISPSDDLLSFNREVPCFCRNAIVVTRRKAFYDIFAVCSFTCFQDMITDHPEYFMANYGKEYYRAS